MHWKCYLPIVFVSAFLIRCGTQSKYHFEKGIDKYGQTYNLVTNDPLHTRTYTLKNGLDIFISTNEGSSRISAQIGIKAGVSFAYTKHPEAAQYVQVLLNHGTDSIGSLDWQKEAPLLQQINSCYEELRQIASLPTKQKRVKILQKQVDSLTIQASQYIVSDEYAKLLRNIGATEQAFTSGDASWFDFNFPSSELDRWAKLQSERLRKITFRNLRVATSKVYNEYLRKKGELNNITLQRYYRGLFPDQKKLLGLSSVSPDKVAFPSTFTIQDFFRSYYVPNNMYIALSGDIVPDDAFQVIKKYFQGKSRKIVPELPLSPLPPVPSKIEEVHIKGAAREAVSVAFRFKGRNSTHFPYVSLINLVLNNDQAGLLNLDLSQTHKIQEGTSRLQFTTLSGLHILKGYPKKGQSLEEVKELLLNEIESIKQGNFPDWLLKAVVNDSKIKRMLRQEHNTHRLYPAHIASVYHLAYPHYVAELEEMQRISKRKLQRFAMESYQKNYMVIYEHSSNLVPPRQQVPNWLSQLPTAPISYKESLYYRNFISQKPPVTKPVYVDFSKDVVVKKQKNGQPLYYVQNMTNNLFTLEYRFPVGKQHNAYLAPAAELLLLSGTPHKAALNWKQELHKRGLAFTISVGDKETTVRLSGLQEAFYEGIHLVEKYLSRIIPNETIYKNYISKANNNFNKISKETTFEYLENYMIYGRHNPLRNSPLSPTFPQKTPSEFLHPLKQLLQSEKAVYYYGKAKVEDVVKAINSLPSYSIPLHPQEPSITYSQRLWKQDEIWFTEYEIDQTWITFWGQSDTLSIENWAFSQLYNEFYQQQLNSLLQETIRTPKALVYKADCNYLLAQKQGERNRVKIQVQMYGDDIRYAVLSLKKIFKNVPRYTEQHFEIAKASVLRRIETERIQREKLWGYYVLQKNRGWDKDPRKELYQAISRMNYEQFIQDYKQIFASCHWKIAVMTDRKRLLKNYDRMSRMGHVRYYALDEILGHKQDEE